MSFLSSRTRAAREGFGQPVLRKEDARLLVGEVVAMVVADTPAAARDGAERVVVDWAPLPAVTASRTAAGPNAPRLYDGAASNVCVDSEVGDSAAVDRAFSQAAHVVRFETWEQRVTG